MDSFSVQYAIDKTPTHYAEITVYWDSTKRTGEVYYTNYETNTSPKKKADPKTGRRIATLCQTSNTLGISNIEVNEAGGVGVTPAADKGRAYTKRTDPW